MPFAIWLWVKHRYPTWNPGKWKHGLKSAVPCWFNFDPHPFGFLESTSRGQTVDPLRTQSNQSSWAVESAHNKNIRGRGGSCFFIRGQKGVSFFEGTLGWWFKGKPQLQPRLAPFRFEILKVLKKNMTFLRAVDPMLQACVASRGEVSEPATQTEKPLWAARCLIPRKFHFQWAKWKLPLNAKSSKS